MASFEVEVLKVVFEKLEVGGWGVEMVVKMAEASADLVLVGPVDFLHPIQTQAMVIRGMQAQLLLLHPLHPHSMYFYLDLRVYFLLHHRLRLKLSPKQGPVLAKVLQLHYRLHYFRLLLLKVAEPYLRVAMLCQVHLLLS